MICPLCKAVLEESDDTKFCSNCGQFIKIFPSDQYEKNNQNTYGLEKQRKKNKKKNGSDYIFAFYSLSRYSINLHRTNIFNLFGLLDNE